MAWTADHRGSTPPKSFFESLPRELEEAAQIDGLGWFGIFVRIVLPLSKAVLATMILFYAVSYWNDWFTAFLYLDNNDLLPLSLFLRNLIAGASTTTAESAAAVGTTSAVISANIQAVAMILAIIPILFIYPFVQRRFVLPDGPTGSEDAAHICRSHPSDGVLNRGHRWVLLRHGR